MLTIKLIVLGKTYFILISIPNDMGALSLNFPSVLILLHFLVHYTLFLIIGLWNEFDIVESVRIYAAGISIVRFPYFTHNAKLAASSQVTRLLIVA